MLGDILRPGPYALWHITHRDGGCGWRRFEQAQAGPGRPDNAELVVPCRPVPCVRRRGVLPSGLVPRATKQVLPVPAGEAGAGLAGLLASLARCSGHELGRQAEDVAAYAVWRATATRDGLVAVLRWADWVREWNIDHPDRPEQAADRGIDLVATYRDGRCTAVQVKLRTGRAPVGVGWEELATFAAKSATEPFTDRLLVLLGDATLSGNALAELARQHALKPLTVWAAAEIETHAGTDWPADHAGLVAALGASPPAPVEPRGLHGYQQNAVRDVHATYCGGVDRAQLLMACGTGKTITTHAVAAQLPAGRLLVLAPSLSLLRQLIGEYRRQYGGRMDAIAVCSDATVGLVGRGEDLDEPVITDAELGVPTEKEPAAIATFLDAPPGERPRVVFATYQSSPRLASAQQLTAAAFDLVVADEAHYLAGRPSPAFATVLDAKRIRAVRRLYTTATPRLVAPHLREADPEVFASMDDLATFGPVAHRLPFGAAIGAGLLADYRLLVLGADEQAAAAIDQRILVDAGLTTDARTLAAALAVLRLARDHGRRRIVTFHSRTAWAKSFADLLETHHKWAPPELHIDLAAEAVTGDQPSDRRAAALARLKNAGRPGQPQVRVVTNARCLTAGVDVPALDAVVFVDPRRSRVDVVQAVGRVLRRANGKDLGYVVVPVPVPDGVNAAAAVTDSPFAPVWDVLAALADHDDVLADQIDQARRALGRTGRVGEDGRGRLAVDVPGIDAAQLAAAVWLAAVTRLGSRWAQGLGALEAFVAAHGHTRVSALHRTADGFALGFWVSQRRQDRRAHRLTADQIAALDTLGFAWDPWGADFTRGLAAVEAFVAAHGHARIRTAHKTEDGFTLGAWANSRRHDRQAGRLPEDRIAELDALGFVWDMLAEDFARGLAGLAAFVAEHGHARLPADHETGDGFRLGLWVGNLRQSRKKGRVSGEQVTALDALGFAWNPHAENFARGLEALRAYVAAAGHARVPAKHRTADGYRLGAWVDRRRQERRAERLPAEQVAALDRVGFVWDPYTEEAERGLGELRAYVAAVGHARVPAKYRTPDGFALGAWVGSRRQDAKKGRLRAEQVAALDALGFVWDPWAEDFARGLAALEAFVAEHGHARVPRAHQTDDGFELGAWVIKRRHERPKGRLTDERIAALDALGFVWDPRADDFARGLAALRKFVSEHGHARVPAKHRTADGFALGVWVDGRRQNRKQGRLTQEQFAALDALGFVWDPYGDDFVSGLTALAAFFNEHGHTRVPQPHRTRDGFLLGLWVNRRRQERRAGRLSDERVAALDALGFAWT